MRRQLVEGTEWDVDPTGVFIAPDGCRVEDDGKCPHGYESPMLQMGII